MCMLEDMNLAVKSDRDTLAEWISQHPSQEEMQEVFLNMDRALKYIHEHGYCVKVFYPSAIYVLDNEPNHIWFSELIKMPSEEYEKKEIIREDIFASSFIQVGLYSKTLKHLSPDFLKNNFDEFTIYLPSDDASYYRGVIQRGASIYYSEFAEEKGKRQLKELESQLDEGGNDKGKTMSLTSNHNIGVRPVSNDSINDQIYRQFNKMNDSAFISSVLSIVLLLTTLFLFIILGLIFL